MNNNEYLKQIVLEESKKIKNNQYIRNLIQEEYNKIIENSADNVRDTLDDLGYIEKHGNQLDNAGPMQNHATKNSKVKHPNNVK